MTSLPVVAADRIDYQKLPLVQLQKTAQTGDPSAQFSLGVRFERGEVGINRDDKQAVAWYRKAAEQGHADAQFNLGVMYHQGQGVPKDFKEAMAWYRKAAAQGVASAQHNLGIMYQAGQGVPQNFKEAAAWHRKAAEQGDADAQKDLGNLYMMALDIPTDIRDKESAAAYSKADVMGQGMQAYKEAAAWYRKAAEQGNAEAQTNLGVLYEQGQGVPQNFKEAAAWHRKAAEQGHAGGQDNLGACYFNGQGVKRDLTLSYMLWSLGAKGGDATAAEHQAMLAKRLSPKQIEEGQVLAATWKVGTSLPTTTKTGQGL
jgi:TPR repeat protein